VSAGKLDEALREGLALLGQLRGVERQKAEAHARALAARHAPLALRLVPERDEYTHVLEYGLLLEEPQGETVYLTARSKSATPWLLHQVHDFREGVLLVVDGEDLSVGEAVAQLDELLDHVSLRERLIDACILKRRLAVDAPTVSEEELQAAVNDFRQRRGLYSAEATRRWMQAHAMSHARVEAIAASAVKVRKLRRALVGAKVEGYFAAHRDDLARASLLRLRFANVELARRARPRCSSLAELLALGQELLANDLRTGDSGERIDTLVVHRRELEPEEDAAIFERTKSIVGPLVTPQGAHLAWVMATEPAHQLDARTRDVIERRLFADWLRGERERATIEWSWDHD
jgi:putative peptide maturation system protein